MILVGNVLTLKAFEMDSLGNGVCRFDDTIVFVKGLIDQEIAEVKITKSKGKVAFGRIVKLLEKSEKRSNNSFKYGAQDLIYLINKEQLKWQVNTTEKTFNKAQIVVKINRIIATEKSLNYRNKAIFRYENGQLKLFSDEFELIPINDFVLAKPVLMDVAIDFNKQAFQAKSLVKLVLKCNLDNEVLVGLIINGNQIDISIKKIVDYLLTIPNIKGISIGYPRANNPQEFHYFKTFKASTLSYQLGEQKILISLDTFLQVNDDVAILVYQQIANFVTGKTAIDAYSGIGTIAIMLAKQARRVIAIESNEKNQELAQINFNSFSNIELSKGKTEDLIANIEADCLVVDPPRKGLHKNIIDVIITKKYRQIAYLSCDLQTLVRDLKKLKHLYQIEITPVRMFPQTASIETLALLTLKDINR